MYDSGPTTAEAKRDYSWLNVKEHGLNMIRKLLWTLIYILSDTPLPFMFAEHVGTHEDVLHTLVMTPDVCWRQKGHINWLQERAGLWNHRIFTICLGLPEKGKDTWLEAAVVFRLYVTDSLPRRAQNMIMPDLFLEWSTRTQ